MPYKNPPKRSEEYRKRAGEVRAKADAAHDKACWQPADLACRNCCKSFQDGRALPVVEPVDKWRDAVSRP